MRGKTPGKKGKKIHHEDTKTTKKSGRNKQPLRRRCGVRALCSFVPSWLIFPFFEEVNSVESMRGKRGEIPGKNCKMTVID